MADTSRGKIGGAGKNAPRGTSPLPAPKTPLPATRTGNAKADQAQTTPPDDTLILEALPEPEDDIYTDDALELKQAAVSQPDTEAEKRAQARLDTQTRKLAKKEAGQTAVILLSMLDGIASIFYGQSASMNDFERDLMKEPLERILMRMDITGSEALAKWSDPLLLVMGLAAWVNRLSRERQEAQDQPGTEEAQEVEQKTDNPKKGGNNRKVSDVEVTELLTAPKYVRDQVKGDKIE